MIEVEEYRKDGSLIPMEISLSYLRDSDGIPIGILAMSRDITDRKRIEKNLRESELSLRTIFDNAHDAIFIHDIDGRVLDVNRRLLELYRLTREQALNLRIASDFSTPGNPLDQLPNMWHRALAGESVTFEWKAKRPFDDSTFDAEVSLKKITLGDQTVVLANVRDISTQKAAETVLRDSEERFRTLVENSRDAIMRFDRQHRHLYVNPIVKEQSGIPAEAFIGRTHREIGFPESLSTVWEEAIEQVFLSGAVRRIEFQLPNGTWIDWILMPERDKNGQVTAVLASARDIT